MLRPDKKFAIADMEPDDVVALLEAVPAQRCISITLSCDPCFGASPHEVLAAALAAMRRGFTTIVNFIACPRHMCLIPDLIRLFEGRGLYLHVDPYILPPGEVFYSYTRVELQFLSENLSADREFLINPEFKACTCDAGSS